MYSNQRIYISSLSLDFDVSVVQMLQKIDECLVELDCCVHSVLEYLGVFFVAVAFEVGQHINPLISDQIFDFLSLPIFVSDGCF